MKLSSSEGIPFRFVAAQELAQVRYRVTGVIPPKLLLDSILSSEPILGELWVRELVDEVANYKGLFDLTVTNIFGELSTEDMPWRTKDTTTTTG
jgi:hypothetical protein